MKTRNITRPKTTEPLTFREKLAYRLDHPKFLATRTELEAEAHRYDFSPKRPPSSEQ